MRNSLNTTVPTILCGSLSAMLCCALVPGLCIAASEPAKSVQVDVYSHVEPSTAVGLLMSAGKTIQKLNPKIEKPSTGTITVSFPYSADEIAPDSVATALVVSEKGEVVFGNVKPVTGTEVDQGLGSLPLCPEEQQVSAALASQSSLLEELYRIRLKRRDQAKLQTTEVLNGPFLERLQKLERGFGLARERELNAELSPLELIDRLSRIRDALRNWETRQEAQPTPQPEAETTTEETTQDAAAQ